jgi:hypothetical protein
VKKFFLAVLFISGLFWSGCNELPPIEIPISSAETTTSLEALSEIISTFDIVEDMVSRSDLFQKKDDSFLPSNVIIYFTDTSFLDGDGVEAMMDFGELGDAPHGVLCKDQKYRAGRIWLNLNKPYDENDARLNIVLSDEQPFYTGDGQDMAELKGMLSLTRASDSELLLHCSDLTYTKEDEEYNFKSTLSISHIKDQGEGLVNDQVEYAGDITVCQDTDTVYLTTDIPLHKDYGLDCAKHIVEGNINAELSSNNAEISIDFDPYSDGACDNKVRITINGKSTIQEF